MACYGGNVSQPFYSCKYSEHPLTSLLALTSDGPNASLSERALRTRFDEIVDKSTPSAVRIKRIALSMAATSIVSATVTATG